MKKKIKLLLCLSILLLINVQNAGTQKLTSIFESCSHLQKWPDIKFCEKKYLLNFIYKEFLPYAETAKKSHPDNELWAFFNIEANGVINEFDLREKPKNTSQSQLKGISLGQPYRPVTIEQFMGKKKYLAYYKFPQDLMPDFDDKLLNYYPEKQKEKEKEIIKLVEQMPRFPGCEGKKTEKEKEDCAKSKMLDYIYANLTYPEDAINNSIEGQVVLQFIVDDEGVISDIRIVRDIGYGCGQAAADVVESMNLLTERWIPGKQRGRNVTVLYTLPVRFKL
jgi:TonB family protein